MTLEQLRIFVEVAERQHLTQAANALALTPSAVSSSIKVLENRYGIPLFNRVGRRIETSEAGRIFLTEARSTLASARAAELTLSELGGLQRGALSIQASQTIASYWLPELLVRFHQQYPQIELSLTIGNTQQVARAVVDGTADLGFIEGTIDEAALTVETVDHDRIVAVVGPHHPWANGKGLKPADLRAGKWILREPGSGTRSALEEMLKAIGVDVRTLQIALTLPSNEAIRSAVMSGPYVTVVSELVVTSHLQTGLLCKANIDLPLRAFYLLHHKARYKTKAALALQEMIQRRQR
ncbi:LysR substrate-binding domain-containing protein [Glaciimonas immobilis]|uniref:DNA-binding transcriptional LysR family regulator n=1 Tax=Glaciimonas immobilis TaxID=728004 RepID=A0A840RJD9_9BURK|nr:LysR substrate-binding domain-containing protein [Glaciimonas immobilis]KAF3998905.1 LysR family transcriptional regulator [Glaciimonas immobilis]MBB5198307.1 DNA-binding transcriptional LysR family regulator [Glaciimonas immobilis]